MTRQIELERADYDGTYEDALEVFRNRGWVDGLPIVIPTAGAHRALEAFGEDTVQDVDNVPRPQWVSKETNPSGMVPMADSWSDFTILVAGGPGAHSVLLPTFLGPRPVMVKTAKDGLG